MDPERWLRIEALYHLALEQELADRSSYLAAACGDDGDLRDEVASLLAQSDFTIPLEQSTPSQSQEKREVTCSRSALAPGEILGHYRITALLGQGGMGTVFRAMDTRLGRAVAIKVSTEEFDNRFEREARVISALNHPHICTLHDVGKLASGRDYIVTELVEGETLHDWLRGCPSAERRIEAARQILEALRAAHGAGIIHRDLKPANIMVRFDGYVKVLDFGLAKPIATFAERQAEDTATAGLSKPGVIVGTISYMSPEQILGWGLDARSDLFSFGIILYEMIAGRHPWPRKCSVDTMHAILHDDSPGLESHWAGLVEKLLRKNRDDRYPAAEAVLDELFNPPPHPVTQKRALSRLIVMPFRILRPHEPSDFLSVALPDAITASLAGIDSLLVRSSMMASQLASTAFDLKTISETAQVDAILTGSIQSDGDNLRVTAQLVQAPDGALLWSHTSQASLRNIFQLQDEFVDRIIQSLTLPLTARERQVLKQDVPCSPIAYEYYLRANQLAAAGDPHNMVLARDLYLRSVEADPKYAPAWACLGRAYRYIGKYGTDTAANLACADDALQKAFALNPDLALAHNFYTSLETDTGRSLEATERLLKRAHTHHNDPNLLTGLVQACRYCGLLEASVAAHQRARQLDPHVRTSVAFTYLHLGDFRKALDYAGPTDGYVVVPSLEALGRVHETATRLRFSDGHPWGDFHRTLLKGDPRESLQALDRALELVPFGTDPEARFCTACLLAKLSDPERALEFLSLALDKGYSCHYALLHDPWLDSLRSDARFTALVNRAWELNLRARTVFLDNGGDRLLGVS
jgi:serine/threonine protein kinase